MEHDVPRVLPARRGLSLSFRGKTLLSRIDPVGQAERIIENLTVKERTLYLCPSPLYGYGLSLLRSRLADNSAILCVEADNSLYELSKQELPDDARLIFVKTGPLPENAAELCALVREAWGGRSFRRVEVLRLNGGWQLFPELYEKLAEVLRNDIAVSWGNAMTLIRLGRLYIRNAVKNSAVIPTVQTVSALDFGGAPVLVLGAGPSMDVILDEITKNPGAKKRSGRPFRIVAADTCLPALREREVEPDLAIILECQHWNLRDFLNTRGWNIQAAVDLSSLPASIRVLGGPVFMFMIPWTELAIFDRLAKTGLLPPALSPLGSVGLTAVELALRLGKGPVITGGMDFSFTADAYHARSTPGHLTRLSRTNRFSPMLNVEAAFREGSFSAVSKSGGAVRSDPALRNYRNLFEAEFSGNDRVLEIEGPGLSLGVKKISVKEAAALLGTGLGTAIPQKKPFKTAPDKLLTLEAFIQNEKNQLLLLRAILTGEARAAPEEKEKLLDFLDYLWAHFPECAAAGGRRPDASNIGFLKRVRTEIDPFIKLWNLALRDIMNSYNGGNNETFGNQ